MEIVGAVTTNAPPKTSLELQVRQRNWFSHWAYISMSQEQYKSFGNVTAWRVTLLDGDKMLGEQKSFLWR